MPDVSDLSGETWALISDLLARVIERDTETDLDSVLEEIQSGDSQLWCLCDPDDDLVGVVVTKVLGFKTGHQCLLVHLTATVRGTRIEPECWRAVLAHLEGVGRMLGCDSLRVYGRKGWAKILPNFIEIHRVFERRIQETNDV